ncbi:MAG: enoyl-CoA hydratase/isomerase family protein [Chloroflexi bacterium]|nr:enoyl-CoA hydratase/isomerase family protein [Chloroflexota bacterium]
MVERTDAVATIRLNRPEKHNALNTQLCNELIDALDKLEADDGVNVLVLTGAGDKAFCAGADLKRLIPLLTGAREPEDEWDHKLRSDASLGRTALLRHPLYKPVISAINGHCLAAGTELIQGTDIRIAAEHATFGLTEVKRGIVPAGGGLTRMPRQVPYARAMEFLLVGDSIPAEEARYIGFVNYVVPQSELMAKAEEFAVKIAENGPLAVRKAKEAVVRGAGLSPEDSERIDNEIIAQVMRSEDAREGPRAYIEKRPPQYKGR